MAWYKGPHIDSACLTTQDTYIRSECTSTNRNKKTLTWGVGGGEERTEKEIEEQRKGEKKEKKQMEEQEIGSSQHSSPCPRQIQRWCIIDLATHFH